MGSDVARPARRGRGPGPAVYRRRRLGALLVLACTVALLSAFLRAVTGDADGDGPTTADAGPDVKPAATTSGSTPQATPAGTLLPTASNTAVGTAAARSSGPDSSTTPRAALVVPETASGRLVQVGLDQGPSTSEGSAVRYAVEIEEGLQVDGESFARALHRVLVDARGWQSIEHVRFVQVPSRAGADLTVTLASPTLTDRLCRPLDTRGRVSCWNGERAVLNARRWAQGAATYGSDLSGYRHYLISHEVGHGLGRHHVGCPRRAAPAPVMVQQTKSLEGCRANPYPAVGL